MRLLLDTHVALWAVGDDLRLSARARALIADLDNPIFVSVVTLWEIAIKYALRQSRPNDMPISAPTAATLFERAGYELLSVRPAHALAVAELPPARTDPFDRMLIAQARAEPLRLLTADRTVAAYGEGIELV
ncbi:MAG TPA: type II toxin-antitoxin system VapC family toxin [Caulobacteraceae bacterium]|nr:type II toxin-antitoxin system VapC family toxin [Caulobacteraceae bacterium]